MIHPSTHAGGGSVERSLVLRTGSSLAGGMEIPGSVLLVTMPECVHAVVASLDEHSLNGIQTWDSTLSMPKLQLKSDKPLSRSSIGGPKLNRTKW